jgi:toxin ParE1/3/4
MARFSRAGPRQWASSRRGIRSLEKEDFRSVKKRAVHYTTAAEADLIAIAEYTLSAWGQAQQDFYLTLLQETCESILPGYFSLARPVEGFKGLYSLRAEHHIIYVREVPDGLEIVRILHERQLPSKQLKR